MRNVWKTVHNISIPQPLRLVRVCVCDAWKWRSGGFSPSPRHPKTMSQKTHTQTDRQRLDRKTVFSKLPLYWCADLMSHARLRRCWYIAHGNGGGAFLYGVFVCIGELVRDTNTSTHLHCLEGYQGKRCCGEEILPIFPFGHGTEKRDRVERKILISLRTLRSQPVSPDSLF